ncbi:mannonate dehydratase [Candidatus Latescibacterota bacterium]
MTEQSGIQPDTGFDPGRRKFGASALAGVFGAGELLSKAASSGAAKKKKTTWPTKPGMKLAQSHMTSKSIDDEQLTYLKQLGIEYLESWVAEEHVTYNDIIELRQKVEEAGLSLYSTGYSRRYNSSVIQLGLPGRDEQIRDYQQFLRDLGKAGIHNTIYAWNPSGIYSTGTTETRGCKTREFNLEEARKKPRAFDRDYSQEELWGNYSYFIERVLPVAEDAGVRLALHPTDPPVASRGIDRIMCSTEDYKRAMEISGYSNYSGIQFCVGTWGEMAGPEGKGEDVIGAIRHFGKSGHIVGVHFRNVSSPVPQFHETFVDNGYLDMYEVMKALWEVGFNGSIVPDHAPVFKDEKKLGPIGVSGTSYTIGYMRGILQALNSEKSY